MDLAINPNLSAGIVNRIQAYTRIVVGTVTNSETGTSFKDHGSVQATVYPTGKLTERGVAFQLHAPGSTGVVVLRVGKVVFDENLNVTFVAGKNIDEDSRKPVCEGLTGQ